ILTFTGLLGIITARAIGSGRALRVVIGSGIGIRITGSLSVSRRFLATWRLAVIRVGGATVVGLIRRVVIRCIGCPITRIFCAVLAVGACVVLIGANQRCEVTLGVGGGVQRDVVIFQYFGGQL